MDMTDPNTPHTSTPDYASGTTPARPVPDRAEAGNKKLAAGICGILLNALGIHKFILGYTTAGLIMLLGTILTCGLGGIVFTVIGVIEGVLYLTKSDEEFYETYMVRERQWF